MKCYKLIENKVINIIFYRDNSDNEEESDNDDKYDILEFDYTAQNVVDIIKNYKDNGYDIKKDTPLEIIFNEKMYGKYNYKNVKNTIEKYIKENYIV